MLVDGCKSLKIDELNFFLNSKKLVKRINVIQSMPANLNPEDFHAGSKAP